MAGAHVRTIGVPNTLVVGTKEPNPTRFTGPATEVTPDIAVINGNDSGPEEKGMMALPNGSAGPGGPGGPLELKGDVNPKESGLGQLSFFVDRSI